MHSQVVCDRIGVDYSDRLSVNSIKRKWLVKDFDLKKFPQYAQFDVVHDFLTSESKNVQVGTLYWSLTSTRALLCSAASAGVDRTAALAIRRLCVGR